MKKLLLLTGFSLAIVAPAFAQGFLNANYFGSGAVIGVTVGSPSNPSSQQSGWYCGSDYTVQIWAAAGASQAESSLAGTAIMTTFLGGATSATGGPASDGAGLFGAGAQDTGLAIGTITIQLRAWYSGGGVNTYAAALSAGVNTGKSALYNITTVANSDPTIKSLDDIGMQGFGVSSGVSPVPEPSTFALAGLGAAALLIFRRRK